MFRAVVDVAIALALTMAIEGQAAETRSSGTVHLVSSIVGKNFIPELDL
jgi:hypothetical protein